MTQYIIHLPTENCSFDEQYILVTHHGCHVSHVSYGDDGKVLNLILPSDAQCSPAYRTESYEDQGWPVNPSLHTATVKRKRYTYTTPAMGGRPFFIDHVIHWDLDRESGQMHCTQNFVNFGYSDTKEEEDAT